MDAVATPPLLKRLNEETVLDTIRTGSPISRAEIARRAGISKPTVSLALRALLEAGLDRRAYGAELADRLGTSVTLENDVNLAALGERRQGVARGVEDFMFLSIGTGLGAGLVLRGELQRGRNGAAGELDYVAAGIEQE